MPWVHVTTSKKLDTVQRKSIADGIAATLNTHIDKDPSGVFVSFVTADQFFWGGKSLDDVSMFDVRWIGEFSAEQKKGIAHDVCDSLAPAAGINGDKTRVVFTSKVSEDWGRR